MKDQFTQAVKRTTQTKALLVLIVLLILRAWRAIPNIRPIHLILPATIYQIVLLIIAAINIEKTIHIYTLGIFLSIAIFMFPMLRQPPKPTAHWVRADE